MKLLVELMASFVLNLNKMCWKMAASAQQFCDRNMVMALLMTVHLSTLSTQNKQKFFESEAEMYSFIPTALFFLLMDVSKVNKN